MKKEDLLALVVYGVMLAIALFVGVNLIAPAFSTLGIQGFSQYIYAIFTILFSFLVNVLIVELGHIVGAILGGYSIKSVNMLGLALVKEQNKLTWSLLPFEGLTGETVVIAKSKQVNPRLFLLGPLGMYIIEIFIAFVVAYLVFNEDQWGRYASMITIAIGGMLMIYNYMPFKLDTVTDGYRLSTLTQTHNREDEIELSRIKKAYKDGVSPKSFNVGNNLNPTTIQIYFHKIYQALVDEDYADATKDLDKLAKQPKIGEVNLTRIHILETYIYFLTKTPKLASKWYYELSSKQRKYLANHAGMSTLSTYLFVAGVIEDSYSEATYTFERRLGALTRIRESGRKAAEEILFDRVLKLVKKKHPDWRF
jgi:hypothetical protein